MSAIKNLDYEYNIGDSIDIINSNFDEISQYITTANNYLSSSYVLQHFLNNDFQSLKEIANIVAEHQYNWEQAYTLVSTNSARWLQPLVFLYPCIFKDNAAIFTTSIKNEVIDWMNKQFPVTSITGEVNYVENQKAYIGITYQTQPSTKDAFMNNIRTLVLSVEGCMWSFYRSVAGSAIRPTPTPSITPSTTKPLPVTPTPTPPGLAPPGLTPTSTAYTQKVIQTITWTTHIDGVDSFTWQGDTLTITHHAYRAPGYTTVYYKTYVPGGCVINEGKYVVPSVYGQFKLPFKVLATSNVKISKKSGRGSISMTDIPRDTNKYKTTVMFDDGPPKKAADYSCTLTLQDNQITGCSPPVSSFTDYSSKISVAGETNKAETNNVSVNSLYMKGCLFAIIGAGTSYNNCRSGGNSSTVTSTIDGITETSTTGGNRGVVGHKYHLFINMRDVVYYYAPTTAECNILYSILSQTPPLLSSGGSGTLSTDLITNSEIIKLTDISKYKIIQTASIQCSTRSTKGGACYGGMSGYIAEIKFLGDGVFTPKPTPTPSPRPRSFSMTLLQLGADNYNTNSTDHTGTFQLLLNHLVDSYFFITIKHKTLTDKNYNIHADNNIKVGVNNLHYGLYDVEITCFNPNHKPARDKITGILNIPETSGLPYFKILNKDVNINTPILS